MQTIPNNPTRLARGLLATQAVLSLCALVPASRNAFLHNLALVPQNALPRFHLWTLLTSALFDTKPLAAVLAVASCALCARPAELALGRSALGILLLVSAFAGAFLVAAVALVAYAIIRTGGVLFDPIATAHGINLATLVALKAHIPEHEVGFGAARLKVNYAPGAFAASLVVLMLLGQLSPFALVMAFTSGHTAWAWLRYVQRNPNTGERGDSSENFAFVTFFPLPLRPIVAPLANIVFAVSAPLCGIVQSEQSTPGPKQELVNSIVQDRASAIDAERRRQRAQKALDDRMAGSASEPAI